MKKRKPRPGGIRNEILQEWRGCELPPDLNSGIHQPEEFIQAILKAAGMSDGLREDQVREAWHELAGAFIARHTEPISVNNARLVLRVNQPSMRFHLEQMKPMLLKRIQEQLGEKHIQSIQFKLG